MSSLVELRSLPEDLAFEHKAPSCKWRLCVFGWQFHVRKQLKATQPSQWWWNDELEGWWVPVYDFDKTERLLMCRCGLSWQLPVCRALTLVPRTDARYGTGL